MTIQQLFDRLPALLIAYASILGLLVGSFLNVVAYRVPRGQSVVTPPSACPACKRRLTAVDLVPVLSYVALRGRCRTCRTPISAQYPLAEAAAGLLYGFAAWKLGFQAELAAALLLVSVLLVISVTDLREMIIPDRIIAVGFALAFAIRLWAHPEPWYNYAIGSVAGFLLLLAIGWLGERMTGQMSMGGGDIKLMLFTGLLLGWKLTLLGVLLASAAGALYGLAGIALGRRTRTQPLPFGPFLALGAVLAYFYGDVWIAAYIAWVGV